MAADRATGGELPGRVVTMTRRTLRSSILALGLCAACDSLAGCDDGPTEPPPPPGLQVLTPRVGGAAGGLASVLLRSDQPARVTIRLSDEEGQVLGAGRTGRDPAAIRFSIPADLGASSAALTVTAVSEGGTFDTQQFTVEGLGDLESQPLEGAYFDIAALPYRAVLASTDGLAVAVRGWAEPVTSAVTGEVQAIAPDEAREAVLVSGASARIATYDVSLEGEPTPGDEFSFAEYDSATPQPVTDVNALHVNGALVAAATSRGMALMDRDTVGPEGETYCRTRSAMTATRVGTSFGPAMVAVAVTPGERVVAGAGYLNIYDLSVGSVDPGGCDPEFPHRGTSVVTPPEDDTQPWGIVSATTTESFIWIGRREHGLIRLPHEFLLNDTNRYFRDEDVWELGAADLPLPVVVDIAPGLADQLWVALADAEGARGGVARISAGGVDLWVDGGAIGGDPLALDTASDDAGGLEVWVLAAASVIAFTTR